MRCFPANIYSQPNGAEKAIDVLTDITKTEKALLEKALSGLQDNIAKGVRFAQTPAQK